MFFSLSIRFAAGLQPLSAERSSRVSVVPGAHRPIVCYVTDSLSLGLNSWDVLDAICNALCCGTDWIQIREKAAAGHKTLELTRHAIEAANNVSDGPAKRARVFVNDRLDVALAAGADGVHLGGESIPVADAVNWCRGGHAPSDFAAGASCHSMAGARAAQDAGANYIFFGPVFDTPSKRGFGAPQGLERLSEICAAMSIPVIAIGGVNEKNAASCIRAGASGIAAIRLFQEPSDEGGLRNFVASLHAL